MYAGKIVEKKADVDEAVAQVGTVEKVIVVRRAGLDIPMQAGRDHWYHELVAGADDPCPARRLMRRTRFLPCTHRARRETEGVVHVHGGYMVQVYATSPFAFDLNPTDIYWCTADPGWVTGHSYHVYGPLMMGATSVFYDGAPDVPRSRTVSGQIGEKIRRHIMYTAPTAIGGLMRHGDDAGEVRPVQPAAPGQVGGRADQPRGVDVVLLRHRRRTLPHHGHLVANGNRSPLITPTPITPFKPAQPPVPSSGIEADVVEIAGHPVPEDKGGYLVIKQPWAA